MKLAYVTTYDPSNLRAWSGLGYYILKALQNSGFETTNIGNLKSSKMSRFISKVKNAYYNKLMLQKYMSARQPSILMDYSRDAKKKLSECSHYEVIFSPGTIPIAYLKTEKPIVFWTDARFAGMLDFYPSFTNLCAETIKKGNQMEQEALSKCNLAIYSSEWAAKTAIQNYSVSPEKIKVVPFGANISCDRDREKIALITKNKSFDLCKLLFIGVDWHRKGGDKALQVATLLNQRGIKTELNIVGCNSPYNVPHFVKQHGFISKKNEYGQKILSKLFSESHFLILPSQAECYGVVFAKASSYGLPSLASKIGGIPSAIRNGKNGWTFSLDASPELYCDRIQDYLSSKTSYQELALSSFQEYSQRLNWRYAGNKVHDLIEEYCT